MTAYEERKQVIVLLNVFNETLRRIRKLQPTLGNSHEFVAGGLPTKRRVLRQLKAK